MFSLKRPLRNLFHLILGGFFIVLMGGNIFYFNEHKKNFSIIFIIFSFLLISIAFEILRFKIKEFNHWLFKNFPSLFKSEEQGRISGLTHFLLAILITYLIFPRDITLLSISFLTFGDLAAVIMGQIFGRQKINLPLVKNKKTWVGVASCFLTCLFIGYLLIKFFNLDISLPILFLGSLTATIVELFFNYPDDNYTIPIISGGVMSLLLFF